MNTNPTHEAHASTLSPTVSSIIAVFLLVLIAFLLINRSRKKKGKPPIRISSLFGKKETSSSGSGSRWYGNYPKLISVDAFKKISGKCYVVFDLETTGLDSDRDQIIEIGAVRVEKGEITERFHQMVNPGVSIPPEAREINHITNDMVKGQPRLKEVLPSFLEFVGTDVLAAHNGGFDASFLDTACMKNHLDAPRRYFDTMRLSVYWPNLKNRKLETFLKAAGITNDRSHRALSDAEATAKLIIASMDKIH
jgi:DNA polymerase-3 subunit alpha (Gram-positive type)